MTGPAPTAIAIGAEGLRLIWPDGEVAELDAVWLRDNCRCDLCGDTSGGRRFVTLSALDEHPCAAEAKIDSEGALHVRWADGHLSSFGPDWLARHARRAATFSPRLWDAVRPPDLEGIDAARARDGGEGTLAVLRLLRDQGVALVCGLGDSPEETEAAVVVLGPIQTTSYGRLYDIVNEGDTSKLSNSGQELAPHTDEPFRYTPPGIIAFHAVRPAVEGGDTVLVDGFRLADEVRRQDADAFRVLTTLPQAFERRVAGSFEFVSHARAIALDGYGRIAGFRFAERSASPVKVPAGEIKRFYRARRLLVGLINDPTFRIELRLEAGQMVLFDNHRLLHGRTAFDGKRHLRQCSVAREDAHSCLRMIAHRLGAPDADLELPMGALA